MLQKALNGDKSVDVHPFKDLSVGQVLQLIEGTTDPHLLEVLDISGNRNFAVEDISKILEKSAINKLYVWDNPQLSLAFLLPFVRAGRVNKLLHPDLFSAPFDEFEKNGKAPRCAALPVRLRPDHPSPMGIPRLSLPSDNWFGYL